MPHSHIIQTSLYKWKISKSKRANVLGTNDNSCSKMINWVSFFHLHHRIRDYFAIYRPSRHRRCYLFDGHRKFNKPDHRVNIAKYCCCFVVE